jgi:tRNA uridine 5-carboxymethylaminomethyl modification enzyme
LALAAGCIGEERRAWYEKREADREAFSAKLDHAITGAELARSGVPVREDVGRLPLREWLRFGGVTLDTLEPWIEDGLGDDADLAAEVAEDAAYAPYLERQDRELKDMRAHDGLALPENFPYADTPGLSREMVERLGKARPTTLAAAGRVPGITPAALAALLVHARRLSA